jgi:hypothetical protein
LLADDASGQAGVIAHRQNHFFDHASQRSRPTASGRFRADLGGDADRPE